MPRPRSRRPARAGACLLALVTAGALGLPAAHADDPAPPVPPSTPTPVPAPEPVPDPTPPPVPPSPPGVVTRGGPVPAGVECRTPDPRTESQACIIGSSRRGRPIVAVRQGPALAAKVVVVVGQMHGTETTGPVVVDELRRHRISAAGTVSLWTVATMNPDGSVARSRYNAAGLDLNRNFPYGWAPRARGLGWSGPGPLSEPETQAMARFLTWVRPDLLVSYHGYLNAVDTEGGGLRAQRATSYGRLTSLPARAVGCDGPCHGTMTSWVSATSPVRAIAFTVETPRGRNPVRLCRVPGHAGWRTVAACGADAVLALAAGT